VKGPAIRKGSAAAALALALAITGCGVETEERARRVNPPSGVAHAWATPTPPDAATGSVPERLYLVRGGGLVAVTRHVAAEPTAERLVGDLLAGPTPDERGDGVTSALRPTDVSGVQVSGGRATVELAEMLDGSGRTDQVLAYAQLVCTLTALPGVTSVAFTHAGQPMGVPRADGSLSQAPATAADYAGLLTR
jgi:spore germination protein GerM